MHGLKLLHEARKVQADANAIKQAQTVHHIELVDEFAFNLYDNSGRLIKSYRPSPTGLKFHQSDCYIRGVKGPVGSGKSTMCLADCYLKAIKMPMCIDGVRRSRTVFVRNTYKDLLSSTFRTWSMWFDRVGNITGHLSPWVYKKHTIRDKNGIIQLEIDGFACDRPHQFDDFASVELTNAYVNEARAQPDGILSTLQDRVGRFPDKYLCPEDFDFGIVLDTNGPSTRHWWYRIFEQKREDGVAVLSQPPGLLINEKGEYRENPDAENLENLPKKYYLNAATGKSMEEIRVQLCGEYGVYRAGQRVYSSYNDDIHSADHVRPDFNHMFYLGWDFGLTPAATLFQFVRGQLRVLKEFTSLFGTSTAELTQNVVLPYLNLHNITVTKTFHDVANTSGQAKGISPASILRDMGLNPQRAVTNDPTARQDAVKSFLNMMVEGNPGLIIDRSECEYLREGFNGYYHFAKMNSSSGERIKEVPEKNHPYSDIHDALQYGALAFARKASDKPVSVPDHYSQGVWV